MKKYVFPTIVTIPTILVSAVVLYGKIMGTYHLRPLAETNWGTVLVLLPVLSFAICVVMLFIKKNALEWKIAAIANLIPILLAFLGSFTMV
jgi:uncharacterized membrane protein